MLSSGRRGRYSQADSHTTAPLALHTKSLVGTSENAVKLQIWTAVSTYLLVAILKKELRITLPLYTILQILSLMQFEKTPIIEALAENSQIVEEPIWCKRLFLFD